MSIELHFPAQGAALVFGGSGGAGSVICQTLARAGVSVAFTYHRGMQRAEQTLARLRDMGAPTSAHQVDGADSDAVQSLVDGIANQYGGLHSIIYAAGPIIDFVPLANATPEQWLRFMNSDAAAVFNLAHAAMPYLRKSKGSITACVTFANRRVLDYDGLSAAPKAAIESLLRQIAAEEGQNGVRANAVGLGWINVGVGSPDSDHSVFESFGDAGLDKLKQLIRLEGRPGTGQELANAVVFLASQQASYITGQVLMVDGGASL
jgi:3-oxoacyl-[acyl-carrier protein] reductase